MFCLHDSRTDQAGPIAVAGSGELRMYACGHAVCRRAHVGDLRAHLLPDLIRRAAELGGLRVTACHSIADLRHPGAGPGRGMPSAGTGGLHRPGARVGPQAPGDPLAQALARADEDGHGHGAAAPEIVRGYEDALNADLAALNIRPAEHAPRASESVPVVIEMISKLIESGNAYVAGDGSVFFDARSFPGYGELSGNALGDGRPPAWQPSGTGPSGRGPSGRGPLDGSGQTKRFHADWALWTGATPKPRGTPGWDAPVWDAPWGTGFPSWHMACSAMSLHYLGDLIDVQTGGIDLRFPHHEQERAQTNAVAGHEVVRHWAHGGRVSFGGQPVAASAGNAVTLADVTAGGWDPLALRLAFLETHYRQQMDAAWATVEAADRTLRRWRRRVAAWACEPSAPIARLHLKAVLTAIANDLGTPTALRELRDLERDGTVPPGAKFETFAYLDRLLGLDVARDVGKVT